MKRLGRRPWNAWMYLARSSWPPSKRLPHPHVHDAGMIDSGVSAAVAGLLACDPDVSDGADLAEMSRWSSSLRAFADYADVRINRRSNELAAQGAADSGAHVLLDEGRLTGREAQATGGRDRVCTEMPQFDDALAAGACTTGHLDALAKLTKDLTDEERCDLSLVVDDLVAGAADQPVALFERTTKATIDKIRETHRPGSDADELDRQRAASTIKRWTDRGTGMKQTLISLDPLRDASLHAVIDAHLSKLRQDPANKTRSFDELRVEAVMSAVSAESSAHRIPEVVIHVDHQSACHGRHDNTLCETVDGQPIPVSTVQRLCCEAIISAVIVNPDGTVDQLCAELRTANRAQRRQLAAMYSTCAHPHCQVAFSQCRMHHIIWWTKGGKTVLANLLPLCETHHHQVHEGGWNVSIDEQRVVSWFRLDGTLWKTVDGPNRRLRRSRSRARPPDPPPDLASQPDDLFASTT